MKDQNDEITKEEQNEELETNNDRDSQETEKDVAEENNTEEVVEEDTIREKEQEIESLMQQLEEQQKRLLRIQADYENYKRRTRQEMINERKYKAQDLAMELLPVIDNFERALQVDVDESSKGLYEGIVMVYNQLIEALKSQGVEQIEAEGKQFDPNLHHAVMQVEDEGYESNDIVEELQKGYILNDRVLRPSMVKVNK